MFLIFGFFIVFLLFGHANIKNCDLMKMIFDYNNDYKLILMGYSKYKRLSKNFMDLFNQQKYCFRKRELMHFVGNIPNNNQVNPIKLIFRNTGTGATVIEDEILTEIFWNVYVLLSENKKFTGSELDGKLPCIFNVDIYKLFDPKYDALSNSIAVNSPCNKDINHYLYYDAKPLKIHCNLDGIKLRIVLFEFSEVFKAIITNPVWNYVEINLLDMKIKYDDKIPLRLKNAYIKGIKRGKDNPWILPPIITKKLEFRLSWSANYGAYPLSNNYYINARNIILDNISDKNAYCYMQISWPQDTLSREDIVRFTIDLPMLSDGKVTQKLCQHSDNIIIQIINNTLLMEIEGRDTVIFIIFDYDAKSELCWLIQFE